MIPFRRVRKLLIWTFGGVCAAVLLTLTFTQLDQRAFRRRAERLLAGIDALELRKTAWESAEQEFQRWGAAAKQDPQCTPRECSLEVTLNDFVLSHVYGSDWPTRIDDYLRYRLKLGAQSRPLESGLEKLIDLSLRVGVRPASVTGRIGMRDGIVWEKGFSTHIEVLSPPRRCSDGGRCPYTLIASSYTVPQLPQQGRVLFADDLEIHPQYTIGRPSGCMGCVAVWAKFTAYADTADVHRLLQFNLSCLTAWHACLYEPDIMPVVWAEHEADRARLKALHK